ncbi:hypothetical protein, partial [Escherichia coli]|uniref:hypothetical protein n=1 Tax=Escherichia coli TaxID=562 RepID=UPI001BEC3EE9
ADRNRSHWSTSKTPSYTKSVSWQHHLNGEEINNDMLVSMLLNSGHGIFSDNDEQETKADSKESAQK